LIGLRADDARWRHQGVIVGVNLPQRRCVAPAQSFDASIVSGEYLASAFAVAVARLSPQKRRTGAKQDGDQRCKSPTQKVNIA
jgi:hypothetical protein